MANNNDKATKKNQSTKRQTKDTTIQMRVTTTYKDWLNSKLNDYGISNTTGFIQALTIIYFEAKDNPNGLQRFLVNMDDWIRDQD